MSFDIRYLENCMLAVILNATGGANLSGVEWDQSKSGPRTTMPPAKPTHRVAEPEKLHLPSDGYIMQEMSPPTTIARSVAEESKPQIERSVSQSQAQLMDCGNGYVLIPMNFVNQFVSQILATLISATSSKTPVQQQTQANLEAIRGKFTGLSELIL